MRFVGEPPSLTGFLMGSYSVEQTPGSPSHPHRLLRAFQLRAPTTPPPLLAVSAVLLRQGMWGGAVREADRCSVLSALSTLPVFERRGPRCEMGGLERVHPPSLWTAEGAHPAGGVGEARWTGEKSGTELTARQPLSPPGRPRRHSTCCPVGVERSAAVPGAHGRL